jgi:hypothetical protein
MNAHHRSNPVTSGARPHLALDASLPVIAPFMRDRACTVTRTRSRGSVPQPAGGTVPAPRHTSAYGSVRQRWACRRCRRERRARALSERTMTYAPDQV